MPGLSRERAEVITDRALARLQRLYADTLFQPETPDSNDGLATRLLQVAAVTGVSGT